MLTIEMATVAAITSPRIDTEKAPFELNNEVANGGKAKVKMFITMLFVPNTFPLFITGVMSQIRDVEPIAIAPAPKPNL